MGHYVQLSPTIGKYDDVFTPTLQKLEDFRVPGDGISASLQQDAHQNI